MADRDWISLDEAIDYLMRNEGVSRRKARRMLEAKQREGKLRVTGVNVATGKREDVPPGKLDHTIEPSRLIPMDGPIAADMLAKDPESIVFTPGDMILSFGFTKDELLAELRAGRLESKGRRTSYGFADVNISAGAFCRWLNDDNAPKDLRERLWAKLRKEETPETQH
jgi:hypothetical protein